MEKTIENPVVRDMAIDIETYVNADGRATWFARSARNHERALWSLWTEIYMDRTQRDGLRYSSSPRRLPYAGAHFRLYPMGDERKTMSALKKAWRAIKW